MSAITLGELGDGIARMPPGKRRKGLETWFEGLHARYGSRIVPVDATVARRWGALSGALRRNGVATSMADGLIAATALVHGMTLVTRNSADFEPFGVQIVDPWKG